MGMERYTPGKWEIGGRRTLEHILSKSIHLKTRNNLSKNVLKKRWLSQPKARGEKPRMRPWKRSHCLGVNHQFLGRRKGTLISESLGIFDIRV